MTTIQKDITASTVANIMQRVVTTVPPDMPLPEIARVLKLLADASETRAPRANHIEPVAREVMTPATPTVRPTTTVAELALFLARARAHRALVIDRGRLVGIVTISDIVTELARCAEPAPVDDLPLQEEAEMEY
jgi:CBS domain-containing protein